MAQALDLAASVHGAVGPNPRVGCVIVDSVGRVVGRGAHLGAGTPHAEVHALREAGPAARGATAYVTLEPCDHHGRTPPCSTALVEAGVGQVHYAVADPTAAAGGGAATLRDHGVRTGPGPLTKQAEAFLEPWLFAVTHGRPFVTYKVASTLDGYVAAADGSSRWITGSRARQWVHELRARVDAVAVGAGTYTADTPRLTVRGIDVVKQPARYVLGGCDVAEGFTRIEGRDPAVALGVMYEAGVRHLLLEGGPTVGAAFVTAGLVDDLVWMTAPKMLGAGVRAIGDLRVTTIADAVQWRVTGVEALGDDVVIGCRRR
jgi:diaminohydroxyphosphoribosylaminopyrimidine deaminase/5-amino-6-(5-phosphoribosylamino)uracil reductase